MTVLAVVFVLAIGLTALVLASSLHLHAVVDERVGRLGARWAALAVVADVPSRVLDVRLFGVRLAQRPFSALGSKDAGTADGDDTAATADRRSRREPLGTRIRTGLATVVDAWTFYRAQLAYLLRRVHVARCDAVLRVAAPDPALTGVAYGIGCAIVHPLATRWPTARVHIEPDFTSDVPGGRARIALKVRVATLAVVAWRVFRHERSRRRGSPAAATERGRGSYGTQ